MRKLIDLLNDMNKVIKVRKDPFSTITFITSSKKLEQWFKTYFLKTNNSVLSNIKFQSVNDFLLSKIDGDFSLVSNGIVKDYIIKKLISIKEGGIDKSNLPDIVKKYLSSDTANNLDSIKIYDLSKKLAEIFIAYDGDDYLKKDEGLYNSVFKTIEDKLYEKNIVTLSYIKNKIKDYKLDDNAYFFGQFNLNNTTKDIIDEFRKNYSNRFFELDSNNINFNLKKIIMAPSKFREIEYVHSEICKILLEDQTATLSDFLVLAPNISEYKSIISSVFKQDNEKFIDYPYTICYKDDKTNYLYEGLKTLFDILNKKSFTRNDFLLLLNNKLIKEVRGVNSEDIDAIKKCILNSYTYRNKDDGTYDDWHKLKNRLITSKILLKSDEQDKISTIELDRDYISFASLDLDDKRIAIIISLIDDLMEFINNAKTNYNYESFICFLNKFFSIKQNDIETNLSYKKILNEIDIFNNLEIKLNDQILNILFYSLLDIASNNKFITGELFVKGVTFLDLDYNAILYSKYLFIIGADSNSLDFSYIQNELDNRDKKLIDNIIKNKKANFKIQAGQTESLYISYIDTDLKTDEDFFISPLINDIDSEIINGIEKVKKGECFKSANGCEIIKISLDETRNYSDLFTRRELENKEYYENLFKEEEENNAK